jgi:hypothetical protein
VKQSGALSAPWQFVGAIFPRWRLVDRTARLNETSIGGILKRRHMDIGPCVALVAVVLGTPYMIRQRQWALAGYFALTAASIVFRVPLGASDIAMALTWLSVLALGVGVCQYFQPRKALTERGG